MTCWRRRWSDWLTVPTWWLQKTARIKMIRIKMSWKARVNSLTIFKRKFKSCTISYTTKTKSFIVHLKQPFQKNANFNSFVDNDLQEEMNRILQSYSNEVNETKLLERILIELMQTHKMASESDLKSINLWTLLRGNDIRQVVDIRDNYLLLIKKAKGMVLNRTRKARS